MSARPRLSFAAAFCCLSLTRTLAGAPEDYSKEALVIEKLATEVTFAADGTGSREQTFVIRVQSEEGVRALGVLGIPYNADNESPEFEYVRVRKPDGAVVATPADMVQDLASEVARVAPTFSGLREKQVPVRGLSAGDVLEYKTRAVQTKPDIPNQFWFSYAFFKAGIAIEETLRITVPANQYVKLSSPEVQPEVTQNAAQKTYLWKTSHLKAASDDDKDKEPAKKEDAGPSVQLTTFRSWEEVGRWYGQLAASRAAVTPAISAKAAEITKGLLTNDEKLRALYAFVSMKFRYISISFGTGRYQPHTADEVLANQYGDCKDKHTLFAAMLKAVGIEAWPALIGAGIKFNPDVPSPAQFNHLITVIPGGATPQWLDTTPEIAPFGLLQPVLREKQALVMPAAGVPTLMETPANSAVHNSTLIESKAELGSDGKLKGHFDFTLRGDVELALRLAFHSTGPAQWQAVAQQIAYVLGFAGTVSHVEVENLNNPEIPFHYSYDYERENYSDWENRRFTPPIPPLGLPEAGDKKPSDPIELVDWGDISYRTSLRLPSGYSIEIPGGSHAEASFGHFDSTYGVTDSTLKVERHLVIPNAKIAVAAWAEYKTFRQSVSDDADHWIQLSAKASTSGATVSQNNPEAGRLVDQADNAIQRRDLNEARDALAQAERLNPTQRGLWAARGFIALNSRDFAKAVENFRKELQFHPDDVATYRTLVQAQVSMKDVDGAIATLHELLKVAPAESQGTEMLAMLLVGQKRYSDAVEFLGPALKAAPEDKTLQQFLSEALLRDGRKEEGLAATKAWAGSSSDANVLNNAAFGLADTGTSLPLALEYAQRANEIVENDSKDVKLAELTDTDLRRVTQTGAIWDTLGWAFFQMGDTTKAEKYIEAAWSLSQRGAIADHLGQIYEKKGRTEDARHAYQLARAAGGVPETAERLNRLGGAVRAPAKGSISAGEELGRLRNTEVPLLSEQKGSAEFFISFSKGKVEETRFITGDATFKEAGAALSRTVFKVPFPDDGPEKVVRRGILSCSAYTKPSCQFVMLLPANTSTK